MEYDATVPYNIHADVIIGEMTLLCQYCTALKWNAEAPGICCRKGKNMLHETNTYVASFKTALEKMTGPEYRVVIRHDKAPAEEHPRRFNAPTSDEVAVLIVG
ncbi:hypothetical protein ACOMHN_065329 [Nucella lapillus]